jgi:hypothetical protein
MYGRTPFASMISLGTVVNGLPLTSNSARFGRDPKICIAIRLNLKIISLAGTCLWYRCDLVVCNVQLHKTSKQSECDGKPREFVSAQVQYPQTFEETDLRRQCRQFITL